VDDPGTNEERAEEPSPDGGERTSGLLIETCYRHPDVVTGVHCTRCGRPICPDCMAAAPVGYQCPECVAAARQDAPRRRIRLRFLLGRPGSATTALLFLNIAMYLVETVVGGAGSLFTGPSPLKLFNLGALFPPAIAQVPGFGPHHQYWRLFTAMFLHAGLLHLTFNMYALYLFGYLIESAFGTRRFLAIYFVSGFLASVVSFAFGPAVEVGVGASGAIFGLLGAWVAFNYRRRTNPMALANLRWALTLVAINAFLALGFRGIDWRAHVGGLITGLAAGAMAEGFGPQSIRRAVRVGGLFALLALGVALAAWRVATFPTAPSGF
jgi:membrane associated rhomboid family serine protease